MLRIEINKALPFVIWWRKSLVLNSLFVLCLLLSLSVLSLCLLECCLKDLSVPVFLSVYPSQRTLLSLLLNSMESITQGRGTLERSSTQVYKGWRHWLQLTQVTNSITNTFVYQALFFLFSIFSYIFFSICGHTFHEIAFNLYFCFQKMIIATHINTHMSLRSGAW